MIELLDNILNSKIFWATTFLIFLYTYLKKVTFSYWQRQNIPHDEFSIPFGIFGSDSFMKRTNMGNVVKNSYEKFKEYPFHGLYMFHNPVLMINDVELVKHILVKDFNNFSDRGTYCNPEIDPLSGHLALLGGDKWKAIRVKLSPTFTTAKLKYTIPPLNDIANKMVCIINESLLVSNIVEMKDLVARYTTDTIFNLTFGIDSNTLRYPNSEFRYYGNMAVESSMVRNCMAFFAPNIMYALRQSFTPPPVIKFFIKLFHDMVDRRRAEGVKRKDFLDSLIDLMDHEQIVDKGLENSSKGISAEITARRLEMLEATAHAYSFFFAGFETSSSVIAHCLYELALNPEIQEQLLKEIDDFHRNKNILNYDSLLELEYLDMVFHETMRKHPTLPFLNRVSMNDYKIPNSDYTIQSGMSIIISVSGLQMDPDIFPEPQKFDPTRFTKENIASRHPYSYLPFGEGPRICIGRRLGALQSKMALFHLLSNYTFSVCEKTPIPSFYSPNSFVQNPRDGIYLKVQRRGEELK